MVILKNIESGGIRVIKASMSSCGCGREVQKFDIYDSMPELKDEVLSFGRIGDR
jgi:hypothetical protein